MMMMMMMMMCFTNVYFTDVYFTGHIKKKNNKRLIINTTNIFFWFLGYSLGYFWVCLYFFSFCEYYFLFPPACEWTLMELSFQSLITEIIILSWIEIGQTAHKQLKLSVDCYYSNMYNT